MQNARAWQSFLPSTQALYNILNVYHAMNWLETKLLVSRCQMQIGGKSAIGHDELPINEA